MPEKLETDWKCVAQSGPTVDGRVIKPEWLHDMGETYDPNTYTAMIWLDHMRYGSYGTVSALKAEEHKDKVKLFAKIKPSRSLLQMNQVWEEYLFFSIEPTEDFAKTGKCYLTGLGMTDSPASLGTDEMRFSKIPGREFTARYAGEEVPDLRVTDDDQFIKKIVAGISGLFSTNNKLTEENDEMSKEQIEKFESELGELKETVKSLTTTIEKFTADNGGGGDNTQSEPKLPVPKESEAFTEMKTEVTELSTKFSTLIERLETAVPGTKFGDNTGGGAEFKETI